MNKKAINKKAIISVLLGLLLLVGCEKKEWPTDPPDLTRPNVVSTIPEDGSLMNPITSKISIDFGKEMNLNSLSELTSVKDGLDNDVAGTWSSSEGMYVFTPEGGLNEAALYSITMQGAFAPSGEWLGSGVSDNSGNSLQYETSFSFSTEGDFGSSKMYMGSGNEGAALGIVQNFEVSDLAGYPGEGQQSVASHPAGTYVYCGSRDNSKLNVIDVATDNVTVVDLPDGVEEPRAVAVTPDGTRVLVACVGSMDLVILNTADNTVKTTISLADFAGDINYMTVNNAGTKAYITTSWDQGLFVIDLVSETVEEYLDGITDDNSMNVAVSADDSKIFLFVAWVEEEVLIIDANNTSNIRSMSLGSGGDGWKVAVNGDFIYASGRWNGGIYRINMTDESFIDNYIGAEYRGIGVDNSGEVVYAISPSYNDDGAILIFNATDLALLGSFTAGNYRDIVTP